MPSHWLDSQAKQAPQRQAPQCSRNLSTRLPDQGSFQLLGTAVRRINRGFNSSVIHTSHQGVNSAGFPKQIEGSHFEAPCLRFEIRSGSGSRFGLEAHRQKCAGLIARFTDYEPKSRGVTLAPWMALTQGGPGEGPPWRTTGKEPEAESAQWWRRWRNLP